MVEFAKTILTRVSFDQKLFGKELRKLIIWSQNENLNDLRNWCESNYGDRFGDEINEAFSSTVLN